jgi:hypothetical protein
MSGRRIENMGIRFNWAFKSTLYIPCFVRDRTGASGRSVVTNGVRKRQSRVYRTSTKSFNLRRKFSIFYNFNGGIVPSNEDIEESIGNFEMRSLYTAFRATKK